MKPDTTLRYATWKIGPDPDRKPPVVYTACKECAEKSPPSYDREASDLWAMNHSGRTGHRYFRECVSVDLTTCPVEEAGGAT